MAKGAVWMVLFKLVERSLGVVSTLILARLLVPADFGVVAMATAFVAMAELLGAFGFDVALIHDQKASEAEYNTAWTCNVLLGCAIAGLMAALAFPIADFYRHPEVAWVVLALAFGPLISAAENIGVVAFRKELDFRREFKFQVSRKIVGVLIVVPLAFWLRSYWALVIGMLFSKLAGTTISYLMHPYRPRPTLVRWRHLFGYSRWLLLYNLVNFARERGTDFCIGRLAGAPALGTYSIAYELANLPTTEISAPLNRALIPGFAKIEDAESVRGAYQGAAQLLAFLALPVSAGLFALAPYCVVLLLGQKWLAAIPAMQVLAFNGALMLFHSSITSVLFGRGFPAVVTLVNGCHAVLLIVLVSAALLWWPEHGVRGAAYAALATSMLTTPLYIYQLRRCMGVPMRFFVSAAWRPLLAGLAVILGLRQVLPPFDPAVGPLSLLAWAMAGGALALVIFVVVIGAAWHLAGRPPGAEAFALDKLRRAWLARFPGRSATGGT